MRFYQTNLRTRIHASLLALALFLVSAFPTYATGTVEELEDATSGLKSELSGLEQELEALDNELNYTIAKIKKTSNELETVREELAIAKGKEEAQYESMMLRIKYMYEAGDSSIIGLLFSSSCMAEFLNHIEYYSAIMEYDRKMLDEYAENQKQISQKEAQLVETQKYLATLQDDLTAKEKTLKDKISNTSTELSTYTKKLEEAKEDAKKAEELAKEEITPIKPESQPGSSSGSSSNVASGPGVSYTDDDVELLAALIECEAGSRNYEGMLAVGAVVVNRMKSIYYPNTLYGVIYQKKQFTPAHDGKLDRVLARGVKASCVKAATDALNGKNNVGDRVRFRAASSGRDGLVIGDNVFF